MPGTGSIAPPRAGWIGIPSGREAGTTKADIRDETTVAAALFGAYGAVNAVSLYVERGRETFDVVIKWSRTRILFKMSTIPFGRLLIAI